MENKFSAEWCLLQNQFDSYEKHSLYIKLFSIFIVLVTELTAGINFFISLLLLVCWLQDAIWKTFQSRINARLLQLEQYIHKNSSESAFQFNREYQRTSLSGRHLFAEYLSQSIRPTVAFPYVVLLLILAIKGMV